MRGWIPLLRLVEAHAMAAERLHADDTTVPVLAKGKTDTARCWIYVRDDRPFGGAGPSAAMRQTLSRPLVEDLQVYMREQLAKLSRGHDLAKAFNYILKRWASFTRFLEDGRVCLSNNAAERGLRGIALGRNSWLFCGSDRDGRRAASMYSLIITAKMNGVDPQAWLTISLPASPPTQLTGWTSFCPGIGRRHQRSPLERHDHARQQGSSRHHHHPGRKGPR